MTYATLVIQFHIKEKNGKQKLQQVVVLIVVLHNVKLHSTNLKILNQIPEFYFIFFQRISRYFKKGGADNFNVNNKLLTSSH